MATADTLLTAEEFLLLADNGQPMELVKGVPVSMNLPTPRHGEICGQTYYLTRHFLDENPLGRLVTNDSGILTEHDPDTVRGADIAYYSYNRVPRGPLPQGYLHVVPELVFEVRSQTDRWSAIQAKVGEYLAAGVTVVCVLDEPTGEAHVFHADHPPRRYSSDEELTFPDVLPGFRVQVRRFFE
jgi:Uma2 family endonuclease